MRKLLFILSSLILTISFSAIANEENNRIWDFSNFTSKELERKLDTSRTCAAIYGTHPQVIDLAQEKGLLDSLSENEVQKSKKSYMSAFIVFSQYSREIRNILIKDYDYDEEKLKKDGINDFKKQASNWLSNARNLINNYSSESKEMQAFLGAFERIKNSCSRLLRKTPRAENIKS